MRRVFQNTKKQNKQKIFSNARFSPPKEEKIRTCPLQMQLFYICDLHNRTLLISYFILFT